MSFRLHATLQRTHSCTLAIPGPMDREKGATREDPSNRAQTPYTASRTATTLDEVMYLYSDQTDSFFSPHLISHTSAEQHQSSHSLYRNCSEPTDLPYSSLDFVNTAEMSRHSSAQSSSKGTQQYQLMSSESPADQAKSMSQVSPGFIFVIFPLSACTSDPIPPLLLCHFLCQR